MAASEGNAEAVKRSGLWVWLRRGLFALAFLVFGLPLLLTVIYRFVPAPITPLMAIRAMEGEPLSYRWISLKDMDADLPIAAIAAEDANYCEHNGFDFKAIDKAMAYNERQKARNRDKRRGASTISQQTAKNLFLWPNRSWVRKGLEIYGTVLIEAVWPKRRILEHYLNVAEMGPGVYGVEAASRHWFGKSARKLSPGEAAKLMAILPSPRKWKASGSGPYVARRASRIRAAMGTVRTQGLNACLKA